MLPHNFGLSVSPSYAAFLFAVYERAGQTQEAMASRRSHAPTNASRLSMSCRFRGAGPIS